jgi:molybdopterin molybdotransferase
MAEDTVPASCEKWGSFLYDLPMARPPSPALVLGFKDARRVVERHASRLSPGASETVALLNAAGRILAEPVAADRDIPPFPRSTRDGYAVRAADLAELPARLTLIGEIKAGPSPGKLPAPLSRGETFSIMTGAPVPPGADAVVMVEHTAFEGDRVSITQRVAAGANIVAQGAEARRGSLLLSPGTHLNETGIALAASVGKAELHVFARPRIAVLTTGDEIVELDAEAGPAQIRNSNKYSLAVQIQHAGAEPVLLPIAPDEPRRLGQLMEEGMHADLLLITGGVSMGRYDLVERVLGRLHAEFFFTGATIQPGRPIVFGRVPCRLGGADATLSQRYFFGLPGNPVSTMVTFELFARPMIEALAGMSPRPLAFLHARLKAEIEVKPGLTRFLPAILHGQFEDAEVELVPWHGSGDIAARTRSNCLVVIPPDGERMAAGEWVAVMLR